MGEEMKTFTKDCKACGIEMTEVIGLKIYCNDCSVEMNKRNNRERYQKAAKIIGVKKAKKYQEESEYLRITGKRRDKSCDGSGLF